MTNKKIAYCTIASANYLPRVLVLEESLKAYNPSAFFHILLCERPEICHNLSIETERKFISPRDVCANWLQMAFYYDITEYNTSLKPYLLKYLIDQGYNAVFYFDPDIEIFGSLDELESLISRHDLVLTPHICQPIPIDGLNPSIDNIIRAGQFNLGFIGIADSKESQVALEWWADICKEYCLFDTQYRFFVDQFWADALPSFIQKFQCLRDPAYNMAYWNLPQRKLDFVDGRWITDSGELRFFHFSGLTDDLTKVSSHQNRISTPTGSSLHTFLARYKAKIDSNQWSRYGHHPYTFSHYVNGRPIPLKERRMLLELSQDQRDAIDNPFLSPDKIRALWRKTAKRKNPSLWQKFLAVARKDGYLEAFFEAFRYLLK